MTKLIIVSYASPALLEQHNLRYGQFASYFAADSAVAARKWLLATTCIQQLTRGGVRVVLACHDKAGVQEMLADCKQHFFIPGGEEHEVEVHNVFQILDAVKEVKVTPHCANCRAEQRRNADK